MGSQHLRRAGRFRAHGSLGAGARRSSTAARYDPKGHDCRCSGGVQAVGQSAWNTQDADASANAFQLWAANDNTPVRIGSAGSGGSVRQANAALAFSLAKNLNLLHQDVMQTRS